jgi:2-polyprenyl-3-methyl-5-hydroxy-6-metoxy-1,4-benzoquinol methylase
MHADVLRSPLQRSSCEAAQMLPSPVQRLVAQVPLRSRVLEIGCGDGAVSRRLASKRGAKVTAIDLVPRSIDMARVRTSVSLGVEYRVADIMTLTPYGFDVAIAVDGLRDKSLADVATRMANAVVPGGVVLISDVFDGWFTGLWRIRSTLRRILPGVTVRRHLGGRYTAIWVKMT